MRLAAVAKLRNGMSCRYTHFSTASSVALFEGLQKHEDALCADAINLYDSERCQGSLEAFRLDGLRCIAGGLKILAATARDAGLTNHSFAF